MKKSKIRAGVYVIYYMPSPKSVSRWGKGSLFQYAPQSKFPTESMRRVLFSHAPLPLKNASSELQGKESRKKKHAATIKCHEEVSYLQPTGMIPPTKRFDIFPPDLTDRCMYVCMYVCMVITYSRIWSNLVRLPILLVVS